MAGQEREQVVLPLGQLDGFPGPVDLPGSGVDGQVPRQAGCRTGAGGDAGSGLDDGVLALRYQVGGENYYYRLGATSSAGFSTKSLTL